MSKGRHKFFYTGELLVHYEAFCNAFIVSHRRERVLSKHDEFESLLSHELIGRSDGRKIIGFGSTSDGATQLSAVLESLTLPADVALFSCMAGYPSGMYPVAQAIEMADAASSALVSLVPGRLAVHCDEAGQHTRKCWWLYVADPQARLGIERRLATSRRRT